MTGTYGKLMELDQPVQAETVETQKAKPEREVSPVTVQEEEKYRGTKQPRHHDTTKPRYRDTTIEVIRTAVKAFGKGQLPTALPLRKRRLLLILCIPTGDLR